MKAVVCTELGSPDKLEIQEVELSEINENQVLIDVEAAGVNFPDALLVQGKYQVVLDPPFIPGNEIAGIVKEAGKNVGIDVGTKVIGLPDIGAFAEEIILDGKSVIPIDNNFPSDIAAGLPINYGTTYYALKRRGALKKGEKLSRNNLFSKRPALGIPSFKFHKILGKKVRKKMKKNDILKLTDIL